MRTFSVLFILFIVITAQRTFGQFEPHPELNWNTIETEHFNIVYHDGTERTARLTAKIAEEIYGPVTSLWGYEPESKSNFVINDVSDVANGATDYINGRIELFSSALDFELRGTHNWLRNVISYPIASIGVPAWFAEGVAQYQRQSMGYDFWDAQRDMILRMYVLNNNMLTYNQMGQFSSITSLKAESIYNSGFGLVRYISEKYGEDKLKLICDNLGNIDNFSIDKAFRKAINIDGIDLYNEWKAYLQKDFDSRIKGIKQTFVGGKYIDTMGFANYFPQVSPNGKKVAYISNHDYDFAATYLVIYDIETEKTTPLSFYTAYNFSWSPDGNKLIYSKRNHPEDLNGSSVYDLYTYDIIAEKEKRLTFKKRAISPTYSNDGKKIAYLINKDGTVNLVVADTEDNAPRTITQFKSGEQIYNPKFSPDGNKILLEYSFEEARKIAILDIENGTFNFLLNEKDIDNRNPVFTADSNKIIYSSNRTGIFNIYEYDLSSKESKQITNVLGGAFSPSVYKGYLVYSDYTSTGFKIAYIKDYQQFIEKEKINYIKKPILVEKYADTTKLTNDPRNKFNWTKLKNFEDNNPPEYTSKPYTSIFNQLSIFPVLRIDNYTKDNNVLDMIKPGIYFFSDELISKASIFGGAFVNRKWERDIYLNFTYNNGMPVFNDFFSNKISFFPKFVFEGFNVTRSSTGLVVAGADSINVGVSYNLLAADLGMEFNLFSIDHNFKLAFSWQKYASQIDPFLIPSSGISVRGSNENYFKSYGLYFTYKYEQYTRNRNMDINPFGMKVNFRYDYEISDINPQYTVNSDGTLGTEYQRNKLHKIDADLSQGIGLFNNKHSLTLKTRGAIIFGPKVDNFYDFYASGMSGMKGYPFYSMGGSKVATANLTYRFPLVSNIDTRISPLYFDKLYMSFYGDIGNAWYDNPSFRDFKKDAGIEFRLQAFSFYAYPTSIFFNASYGFDSFTKTYLGQNVTYGKEWRLYFGVLFGYDI